MQKVLPLFVLLTFSLNLKAEWKPQKVEIKKKTEVSQKEDAQKQELTIFNHSYKAWDTVLKRHVKIKKNGLKSVVDYDQLRKDSTFDIALSLFSSIKKTDYESWGKAQQLAFMLNAYNAFTLKLILTKYPKIQTIKQTGSGFKNPWKKKFFQLFGEKASLSAIRDEWIREKGGFYEPRVHFLLHDATISGPILLNEAIVAIQLEEQLEKATLNFLKDRNRNSFNKSKNRLEVSALFKHRKEDFEKGWRGFQSLEQFFAHYAEHLTNDPESLKRVKAQSVSWKVHSSKYNWKLNDTNTEKGRSFLR